LRSEGKKKGPQYAPLKGRSDFQGRLDDFGSHKCEKHTQSMGDFGGAGGKYKPWEMTRHKKRPN